MSERERAAMRARRDAESKLRAFAQEIFKDWPDYEAMEGWTLVEIGVKHGLFAPEQVTEPCGDNCACAKYGGPFPMMCNKVTAIFTGEL